MKRLSRLHTVRWHLARTDSPRCKLANSINCWPGICGVGRKPTAGSRILRPA
nr:MAG TPA: hypothetical protein [Bacteriophage sp.]